MKSCFFFFRSCWSTHCFPWFSPPLWYILRIGVSSSDDGEEWMTPGGPSWWPFSFFVAVSMTPWAHDVLHLSIKVLLLLLLVFLLYSIICQIIWRTVIYFNERYMSCSFLRGLRPIPYSYSAKMHCYICLGGFWWLNFVLCFNIIANYGKCSKMFHI